MSCDYCWPGNCCGTDNCQSPNSIAQGKPKMPDLNRLLAAIDDAKQAFAESGAFLDRAARDHAVAADFLLAAQEAFDAAVLEARGAPLAMPTPLTDTAVVPEPPTPATPCEICGEPVPSGATHTCRTMNGEPGPLPPTSPVFKWPNGVPPSFPPDDDDREENTGN